VVAGEDLELSIGFSRDRPYLRSRIITESLAIVPIGDTNGVLRVMIVNPLLSQSATASTSINVFSKAKNVSFAVPRDTFSYITDAGDPEEYDIVAQVYLQGALGDEEKGVQVKHVDLVQAGKKIPGDALYFGEKVESARAMMQKFSGTNIIAGSCMVKILMGPPTLGTNGVNWPQLPWTWATWYANLFLGVAASERFKLLAPQTRGSLGVCRSQVTLPLLCSTMMPMDYLDAAKGVGYEVKVPYYHPRKYVESRDIGTSPYGSTLIFNPNEMPCAVFYAFGEDIRVTGFRQVPLVRLRVSPGLNGLVRQWGGL